STLAATAAFGGCVKARVVGLEAATTYYYRFIYVADDGKSYASHVGTTKTAPKPEDDVPVKFAYVSCADYVGRHYHSYAALAFEENVDFFVHLGDYVYETTGDPGFQGGAPERKMVFSDEAGAIAFSSATKYYAAKSISNYRDLYRTIRGDASLQAVHEKFPM